MPIVRNHGERGVFVRLMPRGREFSDQLGGGSASSGGELGDEAADRPAEPGSGRESDADDVSSEVDGIQFALTAREPYVSLVVYHGVGLIRSSVFVEHRGRVVLHASPSQCGFVAHPLVSANDVKCGAFLGVASIVDCLDAQIVENVATADVRGYHFVLLLDDVVAFPSPIRYRVGKFGLWAIGKPARAVLARGTK